jgi:hypothetical protein
MNNEWSSINRVVFNIQYYCGSWSSFAYHSIYLSLDAFIIFGNSRSPFSISFPSMKIGKPLLSKSESYHMHYFSKLKDKLWRQCCQETLDSNLYCHLYAIHFSDGTNWTVCAILSDWDVYKRYKDSEGSFRRNGSDYGKAGYNIR